MPEIVLLPKLDGIGLGKPPFRFIDFSFECGVVDRPLVDIEERHIIKSDLVKKDDELHQIGVGLLPKGFLATPEEVVQEGGDVVGKSVCVQVALKGVVQILRIEADFDVVFSSAVACEDFFDSVAEAPSYLKDEATNPPFRVACAVSQNLLRERIYAAARFPTPNCAKDVNAREQTPLWDDEALRALCGDLFTGIVNLSQDEEKFVSFPWLRKEGQFAGSDSLLRLECKNVQAGEQNGVANVRGREQK